MAIIPLEQKLECDKELLEDFWTMDCCSGLEQAKATFKVNGQDAQASGHKASLSDRARSA